MDSNHKGQPTFLHIENELLRTWNQSSVFFNMIGDHGIPKAQEYVRKLPVQHRQMVLEMFREIRDKGYEPVRSAVNRAIQKQVEFHAS